MNSKKRVVIKKGKLVVTKQGKFVIALSKKVFRILKPLSHKIEIAGSIRRKEKNPVDIDIVLIPKDKQEIVNKLNSIGKFLQGGDKRISFKVEGVKVEIYFADKTNWGAMLLSYTGPFGAEIGLRVIARKKGLLMNQYGIFRRIDNKKIAGKTEKEMYKSLGKKYKKPELR